MGDDREREKERGEKDTVLGGAGVVKTKSTTHSGRPGRRFKTLSVRGVCV